MNEAAIRFGVGDGQRRAATWKCWALEGPGRNDVYLACRELRGALKASLHKSGQWHVAFDEQFLERNAVREEWPTRFMETWQRPAELAPGFTLAFRIVTPFATVNATPSPAGDEGVMWISPPPPGQVIETAVIITSADTLTSGWPGKRSMATSLVGRFQIDNGDSVWVVSRVDAQPPSLTMQLNRSRFFHGKTKADAVGPGLRAIAFGVEADGSRVMYEFVEASEAWVPPRDSEGTADAV
jgi:hypothetical protein